MSKLARTVERLLLVRAGVVHGAAVAMMHRSLSSQLALAEFDRDHSHFSTRTSQ
jgi:hypothetical protein